MSAPVLAPFAAVTAALAATPGAVFAAPATGTPPQSPIATRPLVSHPRSAIAAASAQPAEPGASAARGSGAGQTGLVASSVAAATGGAGYAARDSSRVAARRRAGSVRIRAPPQ